MTGRGNEAGLTRCTPTLAPPGHHPIRSSAAPVLNNEKEWARTHSLVAKTVGSVGITPGVTFQSPPYRGKRLSPAMRRRNSVYHTPPPDARPDAGSAPLD